MASPTAFSTLGAVCPRYCATMSTRAASRKINGSSTSLSCRILSILACSFSFFLTSAGMSTTPIFTIISPTMRATTVFPVPGFPKKRMWNAWPPKLFIPSFSRHRLSLTKPKSWPMASFTVLRPTKFCSFSSKGFNSSESSMSRKLS
eukprot:Skav216447  [mRNA]  locus=scaffold50:315850:327468:- [translate_table: standard]